MTDLYKRQTENEIKLRKIAAGDTPMSHFRSSAELGDALKAMFTSYDLIADSLEIERAINNKIRNYRDVFFADVSDAIKKFNQRIGDK